MGERRAFLLVKRSMETPELEARFLHEFRQAAIPLAAFAAFGGATLYAAFFFVAWFSEEHTTAALVIRAVLSGGLAIAGVGIWLSRNISSRKYVLVAALGSAFALGGTVLLLALPGNGVRAVAVQASPAIMFGLFLHYAFLRLPIAVSALVGWSVSVLAIAWAPMVIGGSEFLRSSLYLFFANVFGMLFCFLVESRERELFRQRRRAETARLDACERQAAAEEADRQKTRLIAAVSHDLRQPMSAALAYIEVLRSRINADDLAGSRASADRAHSSLTMLGATLDHLLTAARYDSGTEALDIRPVELVPMLRDLYGTSIGDAEKRAVRLRVRLPRTPVVLVTDARSMQRVLSNLVANAIKFTGSRGDREGRVLVAARMRGDRCRIDVIDTGIGIAPESFEEIWKPYVQLDNVERDRERGLGLGLFLVRRIAEQLPGHEVTMASRPGKGSRFTVTLPALRVEAYVPMARAVAEAVPEVPAVDPSPLRGAYVLLVEDDRDARTAIADLLGEWGIGVTAGVTVAEVLAANEGVDRTVDAIVCDYRLAGGFSGLDAIAVLRERLGYAPHAVLITGEPDIEPLRARAGPNTTVLHKPFRSEYLALPLLRAVAATRELERS